MTVDPDRAPIFVVGTGRSGTTLLRLMLNAHPRIYLTHEATFYMTLRTVSRRASAEAWLQRYTGTFLFAWLRLDPAEVRAELPAELPRRCLPDCFRALMRCKARQYGKQRYGDKTPFHVGNLKQIFCDFEDPRVVHIVRDPRAAVESLLRMPWAAGSYGLNNWYCQSDYRLARRYRDRLCEVRLEDLIATPRETMARVLEFVGEPWDDAVLDHTAHAPLDDVPPFPWLLTATRPRDASGTAGRGWRHALPPAWVRNIERVNRLGMRHFGYQRAHLVPEPSFWQQLSAAVRDLPDGLRYIRRLLAAVRALRRRSPPSAADAQRAFLQLNPDAWRHYPEFEIPDPPPVRR